MVVETEQSNTTIPAKATSGVAAVVAPTATVEDAAIHSAPIVAFSTTDRLEASIIDRRTNNNRDWCDGGKIGTAQSFWDELSELPRLEMEDDEFVATPLFVV